MGGKSQMDTVRRYIASQAHHRKLTSQEEFLAVPNAHEIEYNERYIWKRMLLSSVNRYLLHFFKSSAPLSPARAGG